MCAAHSKQFLVCWRYMKQSHVFTFMCPQIELELKKKSEENLTKIMKDFKEMKAENAGLIKKLKNQ